MPAEPTNINVNPIATYRFAIAVDDREWVGVFTECKLPDVEWDIQELKEGGQNEYTHILPGQRKSGRITFRHGLTKDMFLSDWYAEMMGENFTNFMKTITVTLLNEEHQPVLRWNLHNAYPTKVTWPELKTADNAIAIQSLEIACARVEFEKEPA